jgi:SulP family sulfate permease
LPPHSYPSYFGVYVQKGEHQYETVYRIIVEAIHYTHLPTLGMAALGFALMIGVKKINSRLPYVLIAVIITTFVSWLTGFEQLQKTAAISNVECEKTVEQISEYNSLLDQLDNAVAKRIEINNAISEISGKSGELNFQIIDLEHDESVINLDIKQLKDKIAAN